MEVVSLFTGCGGMDFGVEAAGGKVIFATDIMPETKETIGKYFKDTEFKHGDIREIKNFPTADIVVGGYPCQSFSMGGNRNPANDPRTFLFLEYARAIKTIEPKFFVAENVSGMKSLGNGKWLETQLQTYSELGKYGYHVSWDVLHAQDFGVPQKRKRLFIVGVRKDLGLAYSFPKPTHTKREKADKLGLLPYASHGEAIKDLPKWPQGEFYERPHDPEGHMSWYYMSRNRKAKWAEPSFAIVANFRHITLHPASSTMKLVWSNLADGFKQKWEFTGEYEHLEDDSSRFILEEPRRLSWREAARIQTFPKDFEPVGKLEKKFEQIGNAVPPLLMKCMVKGIIDGSSLKPRSSDVVSVSFRQTAEQFSLLEA